MTKIQENGWQKKKKIATGRKYNQIRKKNLHLYPFADMVSVNRSVTDDNIDLRAKQTHPPPFLPVIPDMMIAETI